MPTPSETPDLPQSDPLTGLLKVGRKRTGTVARKAKVIRDPINQMILDGLSYGEVIAALGDDGKDLNEDILSRWRTGGHQEWLRDQQKVDALRGKQEFAFDLVCAKDGNKVTQANLQIAAANLCHLLLDLEPCKLREALEEDPDKYTRLVNMLVRLSDGELRCEQHQARQAQLAKSKNATEQAGISDGAMQQAKDKLNLM